MHSFNAFLSYHFPAIHFMFIRGIKADILKKTQKETIHNKKGTIHNKKKQFLGKKKYSQEKVTIHQQKTISNKKKKS